MLNDSGALLVVFDIEFYEKDKQWDSELAGSFTQAGNVVSGEMVSNGTEKTIREALYAIGSLKSDLLTKFVVDFINSYGSFISSRMGKETSKNI